MYCASIDVSLVSVDGSFLDESNHLFQPRSSPLLSSGYGNRATKVFVLDYPPGIPERLVNILQVETKSRDPRYPPEAYDCHSHRWALVFRVRQPMVNVKITREQKITPESTSAGWLFPLRRSGRIHIHI